MLDRSTVDRLRTVPAAEGFVLTAYLGHGPDLDELRTIPTRLKALVGEARGALYGDDRALRRDLDELQAMGSELGGDLGRGTALVVSGELGLREHVVLPAPVRDRLVIDATPYLGPMEAILDQFHQYAAAVVDRRGANLYRFHLGELQAWEELAADEPIRKDNYGGFAGYAERRVRAHADAVARRLFQTVAERIADLARTGAFDLLVVGGTPQNTTALVGELPPDVAALLAGTFTLDPNTATPSDVRDRCREVAAAHDATLDAELVEQILGLTAAGGRGAAGIDDVLQAANLGAVDRLLVDATGTQPGVACSACGAVARSGERCGLCGSATRAAADLVDAIAERVRATGGGVRYVLADTPLADHVVAAALRYPIT